MQTWQSLSKLTLISLWFMAVETAYLSASALAWTVETTHLSASASAWIGMLVFTLMEQANTKFPLQSLAIMAIAESNFPTAASQFIFVLSLVGLFQWVTDTVDEGGTWWFLDIIIQCSWKFLWNALSSSSPVGLNPPWTALFLNCHKISNVRASSILPITLLTAWSMLSL